MSVSRLPQLDRPFLTDAGLETDMLFNRGLDLPCFASITLLQSEEGRQALDEYFRGFLDLAKRLGTGIILESATWRASPDWAEPLEMDDEELARLNDHAVSMLVRLREDYRAHIADIIVSGCIGPRGDGYQAGRIMLADEARAYHLCQARQLHDAGADMLSAITMTNIPEAIGLTRAAQQLGANIVISFTVETDGRLPTGDSLSGAIDAVDAATCAYPAYYMLNCAHPTHFAPVLDGQAEWTGRIRGVRANASKCSHAELDAMTQLDKGDVAEFAALHRDLRTRFPHLTIWGGCCGTDLSHVTALAEACLSES
ncbi:homocysteine S-methyltransferase family protein [Sphingobium sp.]|uniref:homocysteine S-methyltransferase family protein n=1 Tax=Sphingobium sp. TaxID=1912891 RepID=UPI002D178742|nr:homocysteine S-methyltransferase family protein [Sphingobium sp.]HUD93759.1 homocysteine S-methyltransferase family protein [Sphingobium sp.]